MSILAGNAIAAEAQTPRFLRRVLVATDGSENGDRAVTFAASLARRHDSTIDICYVMDRTAAISECVSPYGMTDSIMPLMDSLDETARSILGKARARVETGGVLATTVLLEGGAAAAIVERANAGYDAIVLGTQGRRGLERAVLGSTADGVLRRANVPVFVVPHAAHDVNAPFDSLLVAVDDSDPSDAAVAFAIELARAEHARVVVCGVADTGYLEGNAAAYAFDPAPMLDEFRDAVKTTVDAAAERARDGEVAAEELVVDGHPAAVIAVMATSYHARAIVIGTHGRRGLRRWMLGSVAESVVARSPVLVVVVRTAVRS